MFKKNDGIGVNAMQNKFTALLKTATRNQKIKYVNKNNRRNDNEIGLDTTEYFLCESEDFIHAIIDSELLKNALKCLSEREKKIMLWHLIADMTFVEISERLGITYKTATSIYYRSIAKIRKSMGWNKNEF